MSTQSSRGKVRLADIGDKEYRSTTQSELAGQIIFYLLRARSALAQRKRAGGWGKGEYGTVNVCGTV